MHVRNPRSELSCHVGMQLFAIDEDYIENGAAKFGNDLPMLAKSSPGAYFHRNCCVSMDIGSLKS